MRRNRGRLSRSLAPEPPLPLLLAVLLCLGALLLAPEQPRDQEAICQRHKGAEACRVW
ncbi:MAG: hypothetical protein VKJ44_09405 [Synechococcus sp.]|nr:hypothetical protein [Synechococcus sp.]